MNSEETLQRITKYCAYQERCHQEVRSKLYELKVEKKDIESILSQLIENGSLNEERFARAFVRGRFRIKKWGRKKIIAELKRRQITQHCIARAIKEIDEAAYRNTLSSLYTAKLLTLKNEKNKFLKHRKIKDYLLQKGYELALINDLISK